MGLGQLGEKGEEIKKYKWVTTNVTECNVHHKEYNQCCSFVIMSALGKDEKAYWRGCYCS